MNDSVKPVYVSALEMDERVWYEDLSRSEWDDLDDDGPCYDEVMRYGEKVHEESKNGRLEQIWKYAGKFYTMVWDKQSGKNLSYMAKDRLGD